MMPYGDNPQDYWTGYYTSRQAAKKQVRDGQAHVHASNRKFAEAVVQQETEESEIEQIMAAKEDVLDDMGVY